MSSTIYYEKNGNLVWKKDYSNRFIKCVIPFNGRIIIAYGTPNRVSFGVLNDKGEELEVDDIHNYYPDGVYKPEFMVEMTNGFLLASTKDESPLATQIMYFSKNI